MKFESTAARLVGAAVMAWAATTTIVLAKTSPARPMIPNMLAYENPSGHHRTYNAAGAIDLGNAFFQSLGTNGRSCGSCHQPSDGWTVTPAHIQERFDATGGLDPSRPQ